MSDMERARRVVEMASRACANGAPETDLVSYAAAAVSFLDHIDTSRALCDYVRCVAELVDTVGPLGNPDVFSAVVLEYGRRLNQLEQR